MNRQTSSLKSYKKFRSAIEDMRMTREEKEALWEQWSRIGWYEKHSSASAAGEK